MPCKTSIYNQWLMSATFFHGKGKTAISDLSSEACAFSVLIFTANLLSYDSFLDDAPRTARIKSCLVSEIKVLPLSVRRPIIMLLLWVLSLFYWFGDAFNTCISKAHFMASLTVQSSGP